MILPNGITGFFEARNQRNSFNVSSFKEISYALANANDGKMVSIDTVLSGKNFYVAKMVCHHISCYLLMNAYYPYTAFADSFEYGSIQFIDKPMDFIYPFSEHQVLCIQELSASWHASVGSLNHEELVQMKYWSLMTIGEIIFNFWD